MCGPEPTRALLFDEYVHAADLAFAEEPRWRYGQTLFNVLYRVRPDLSERVRGTDLDPFHSDQRVRAFLAWVAENWG